MIRIRLRDQMRAFEARTGQRLTYADLARLTGLSRATLETLGSRSSYNTTLATIDRLCTALGCDLSELVKYERTERLRGARKPATRKSKKSQK